MKIIIYLFIFLFCYSAYSQSFSVYYTDPSAFPKVNAKFFVFDELGNQITNLSPADFLVTEGGLQRLVTDVSCPEAKEPIALSSVLVIDVSGSMQGAPLEMSKAAAYAWLDMLALGKSECAVTSFNDVSYVNQDFTTDKSKLINCISNLWTSGGTNYDAALIGSYGGGIDVAKTGKYRRVIVYISDGGPNFEPKTNQIVSEANANNISIYCITIGNFAPQCMKDFSNMTGGLYFENIRTTQEAEDCYRKILAIAQGGAPCEIQWESDVSCSYSTKNVEILLTTLNIKANTDYKLPDKAIARLVFSPISIKFPQGGFGIKQDTSTTVTAVNSDFNVTNITSSNPAFAMTPTSFFLKTGQSIDLDVSYTALDSTYTYTKFSIENDKCPAKFYASGGFTGKKPKVQTLKLTNPDGGETYVVGNDTLITWEGILPSDTVKIEYSIDNGSHWTFITDTAKNLQYIWKNIPAPASNKCLVKATQLADTAKTYKPGTLITTLESHIDMKYWYGSPVTEVQWSPSSKLCAISNTNNSVSICDAYSGKIIQKLTGHLDKIIDIAWNPFGDYIATVSNDKTAKIWNPVSGENLLTISNPTFALNGLNWSPDGNSLVTPSNDGTAIVWDALSGTVLKALKGHANNVTSAVWSPDGKFIATSSTDHTSKIWDVKTGTEVFTFGDTTLLGNIRNISWSPCGSLITTSTSICGLAVWDADTKELINLFYGYGLCSPDDSRVAVIRQNKTVIYDVQSAKEILALDGYINNINTLCWNPDGKKIAIGYYDNTVGILDAISGNKLCTITKQYKNLLNVNWSPDGSLIATSCADSTAKIWFGDNLPMEVQYDKSDSVFSIVAPQATSKDIDMGKCPIGGSKDSLIVDFISNSESFKFQVDSIYFTGPDADAFKLVSGYPEYEVNPSESKAAEFKFIPNKIGIHNATINIITQSDSLKQSIQGEGVEQKLEVISKFLDFGLVDLGSEKTIQDTALIKNMTGSPLLINNVVQLGPDKAQFEIINGGGQFTLQPNETRKLTVRFSPIFVGRTSGQLGFEYNGTGSPAAVQLFGTGVGGFLVNIENDSAYAGEERSLRLMISKVKPENIAAIAPNFEATIRFHNTILTPVKIADRNMVNDSVYMIVHGTIGSSFELAKIPVIAGLGFVEETKVDIVDFKFKDILGNRIDFDIETQSGTFKLLGICREGGTRLINPTGKAEILSIVPNPASEDIEIKVNLIEDGATIVSIFNSNGMKIQEYNIIGETGQKTINLNARDFSNGLYFIQLQTPTVLENQKLLIIK